MTFMGLTQPRDYLATDLANRLRQRIQAGSFVDGDLFMTEAQVATEYEVSRTVAREAVSRLTALGIVEGRQRKGLVVRKPDPLQLFSQSLPSLGSSDDLRELSLLRYVLEVGAIELTVRNATAEQVEQLGQTVDAMSLALQQGEQSKVVALDLEFHAMLLKMTGSTLVAGMQQVLVRFFAAVPYAKLDDAGVDYIIWEHRELYAAVRDRDVERARNMIRMQLRRRLPEDSTTKLSSP